MESIGWLHLTDLHQGQGLQRWLWPNVREDFYRDLRLLHDKSGPWDAVLFTGDLAFSGKPEEYEALNKTLENLWKVLKDLGSEPVLLPVPGNHDLSRPETVGTVKALKLWHDDSDIREDFWNEETGEYRKLIDNAFSSFTQWRRSCAFIPQAHINEGILPGDFSYVIRKGSLRIGVVGLNSSFLQLTGENYKGRLDLDVRQLHAACKGDATEWIKEQHASLLLTHHPYSWLHQSGQDQFKSEIYIPDRFVIHLHGHMHEHDSLSSRAGGAAPQRYLQGSSLFGLEVWGDGSKDRKHGYSSGRISIEGDKGTLKIWPRERRFLKASGHYKDSRLSGS